MTTDKTPATLATVKHGGCVQLPTSASRIDADTLWWLQDAANTLAEGGNESHAAKLHELHAALSAQPSPGGQGDALAMIGDNLRSIVHLCTVLAESINSVTVANIHTEARHALQLLDLAASQPDTDEQYADEQALIDHLDSLMDDGGQGGEKWEPAQAAIAGIIAARQPVGKIDEAAVLRRAADVLYMWEDDPNLTGYMGDFKDACSILELLAQHAAPPAQAVDLGALREMLHGWKKSDYPFSYEGQCAQRALDGCVADLQGWLDSQAVGK
jgi:hypothetical protein